MSNHYERSKNVPKEHHVHRVGDWMPGDSRVHKEWLSGVIDKAHSEQKDFHPVIKEFQKLIETNTRIYMLMQSMFLEIPKKKPYSNSPTGGSQVRDYQHLLVLLNHMLTTAPHWSNKENSVGMVGLPISAVLDWPMGTPSGYAAFQDPEVNGMFKKILNAWGEFLMSPESADQALHGGSSGWFSETGKKDLEMTASKAGGKDGTFEEHFVCDPKAKHFGFKSWDDFFTRLFRDGVRPLAGPDDDNIIANACESKTYNIAHNIKLRDTFWIKGQPYSAVDMLAHDELAPKFEGGTVYQAFLSALSYHRWHSPVSGKIVKAYTVPGTYYSEPLWEGIGDPEKQTTEINMKSETASQGYLTHMAVRSIIFIEADNPKIGLMAFLAVGMDEVSSCDITVKEGQHVKKGEQTGMFHFGGSTHCLLFRKGVNVQGFPQPGAEYNVPLRSQVAYVK